MGWGFLLIAVVLEVAWASTMKWTDGYTRPGPTAVNFLLSTANLVVLAQAMKVLPTALAYSVWTGLGAVGVALVAFWFQGEHNVVTHSSSVLRRGRSHSSNPPSRYGSLSRPTSRGGRVACAVASRKGRGRRAPVRRARVEARCVPRGEDG